MDAAFVTQSRFVSHEPRSVLHDPKKCAPLYFEKRKGVGQYGRSKSKAKDPSLIRQLIVNAEGFNARPPAESVQFAKLVLQSLVSPQHGSNKSH